MERNYIFKSNEYIVLVPISVNVINIVTKDLTSNNLFIVLCLLFDKQRVNIVLACTCETQTFLSCNLCSVKEFYHSFYCVVTEKEHKLKQEFFCQSAITSPKYPTLIIIKFWTYLFFVVHIIYHTLGMIRYNIFLSLLCLCFCFVRVLYAIKCIDIESGKFS